MNKLTKKYRIVHYGKELVFPLEEKGMTGETFPANNATSVEFDTYEEAKAYVDKNGLVYPDPSQSVINQMSNH